MSPNVACDHTAMMLVSLCPIKSYSLTDEDGTQKEVPLETVVLDTRNIGANQATSIRRGDCIPESSRPILTNVPQMSAWFERQSLTIWIRYDTVSNESSNMFLRALDIV